MKALFSFLILISLIGCGQGFKARNSSAEDSADAIDAYYLDEVDAEDQLQLDLGDREVPKEEDQLELPMEEVISPDAEAEVEAATNEGSEVAETEVVVPAKEADQTADSTTEKQELAEKEETKEHKELQQSSSHLSRPQLLKPTVYYLPSNKSAPFKSCKANQIKSLKAKVGQSLLPGKSEIRVCSAFYYAVQMQGTGLVFTRDGRELLINYVGAQEGLPRYKVIDRKSCPYGLGMANLCLQPFISIAADPGRYKLGDVVYLPVVAKAKIRLPDGDIHRGFFIVTDTGEAIRGTGRFDFYTGPMHYSDRNNPFVKLGLQDKRNPNGLTYQQVRRGSSTEKRVQEYYRGRQIIPYRQ